MPDNLPSSLTSFVRRPEAQAEIRRLLASDDARLVTVTGPGGVGKTRLALEVATSVRRTYKDGVYLADLAQVREPNPTLVTHTIAEALGLRDQSPTALLTALCSYLRERELLLLLDNCEHIADAAADVAVDLLRGAPKVRVLATSRRALLTPDRGEHVYTLDAMPCPDPDDPESGWQHSAALALMEARATAVRYAAATEDDRRALAHLCRRADGLPLSIELLAATLRSATPQEVLARPLPDGVTAVWEHSYLSCTGEEQLLWQRLSVFGTAFDLEDAEQVCADDALPTHRVWPVLDSLIAQSLVEADRSTTPTRYSLREPIREFGEQCLAAHGDGAVTRMRAAHLRRYRRLAAHATAHWFSPAEIDILLTLRRKQAQIWAASAFAEATPAYALIGLEMEIDLAGCRFPFLAGSLTVSIERLERLVTAVLRSTPSTPQAARLCVMGAALAAFEATAQGSPQAARLFTTWRALNRAIHPPFPDITVTEGVAALLLDNDPARAVHLLAEARDARRTAETSGTSTPGDTHMARLLLTMAAALGDDPVVALTAAEECQRDAARAQAPWAIAWADLMAGLVQLRHGGATGVHHALDLFFSGLRAVRAWDDRWLPPFAAEWIYWAFAALGRQETAAEWRGAAETLRQGNHVLITAMRPLADAHRRADELVLPPRTPDTIYADAYQRGRHGTHAEVLTRLLGPLNDGTAQHPVRSADDDGRWKLLTRRERDIVPLIAQRLTNQQIAQRLVLKESTVRGYVSDILGKTNFRTRRDITEWYTRLQPSAFAIADRRWLDLSPQLRTVVSLVARGLTNNAIARQMALSVRTVEGHVSKILVRNGFAGRAEIITWYTELQQSSPAVRSIFDNEVPASLDSTRL